MKDITTAAKKYVIEAEKHRERVEEMRAGLSEWCHEAAAARGLSREEMLDILVRKVNAVAEGHYH